MTGDRQRTLRVDHKFSLAQTCGPAAWVGGRSPRHQWHQGTLTSVEWEGEHVVWRRVSQRVDGSLDITGIASPERDAEWARNVLGLDIKLPTFMDPVIVALASSFPGLRPMGDGSLFEGIMTAIIGQSISVAAAAVTQTKLASRFGEPLALDGRNFWPLPTASQLAEAPVELIRESGVTWKRAEAIRGIAERQIRGELPSDADARTQPEGVVKALVGLPGVGRWTAESAVLWGVGAPNAHPTGDVALLRAAKAAYAMPELTLKELDRLAEEWQPARALAARLLWTNLFGSAPV
ncbi:MAG: DNA-3-methyladenine glycosylase family protein [Thermomicrobiales bacterium]